MNAKLWKPSPQRIARANLTAFARRVDASARRRRRRLRVAVALVDRAERGLLARVWDFGRRASATPRRARAGRRRQDARRALVPRRAAQLRREPAARARDDAATRSCSGARTRSSAASRTRELLRRWSRASRRRCARRACAPGDRVAASAEHAGDRSIAMLAAASLGAIWSSCSPDFGVQGVLDRFGQIEPKVLFCRRRLPLQRQDASTRSTRVREIAERLPTVERVVVVPYLDASAGRVATCRRAVRAATTSSRRYRAGDDRLTRSCRSTTRSTSCTPRAPPACRSASCTAPAARCCST